MSLTFMDLRYLRYESGLMKNKILLSVSFLQFLTLAEEAFPLNVFISNSCHTSMNI